jgi:hypothetical protein
MYSRYLNHKRKPSGLPHGYILTVSAALKVVLRIRFDFALLDPELGARKLAKINKSHLAFQNGFCTYVDMIMT